MAGAIFPDMGSGWLEEVPSKAKQVARSRGLCGMSSPRLGCRCPPQGPHNPAVLSAQSPTCDQSLGATLGAAWAVLEESVYHGGGNGLLPGSGGERQSLLRKEFLRGWIMSQKLEHSHI